MGRVDPCCRNTVGSAIIGVDLDDDYVALARQRVADEGDEVDLAVDGRSGRDIVDDVVRALWLW